LRLHGSGHAAVASLQSIATALGTEVKPRVSLRIEILLSQMGNRDGVVQFVTDALGPGWGRNCCSHLQSTLRCWARSRVASATRPMKVTNPVLYQANACAAHLVRLSPTVSSTGPDVLGA
jgi:hypothetical protein